MQIIPTELTIPLRLTCSGCRHWQEGMAKAPPDTIIVGRCARFGETRPAEARPRCNICWEPPAAAVPVTHIAET